MCDKLRVAFPGCALTTDVMVGFPGETAEEFDESLKFVGEIGFSRVHCFPYSRREGTPAARASAQVPQAEKLRRNRLLIAAAERSRVAFESALVGQTVEVLPETECSDGRLEGYTDTYVPVLVDGGTVGVPCAVRITGYENGTCIGCAKI